INSFSGALTSLALNLSPSPYAVTEIVFWLVGSLADRSLQYLWLVLPLMLVGWTLLMLWGPALDGLTFAEDTARSLGFNLVLPPLPELKLGVVTPIIRAPFLFSLIYRLRSEQ